MPRILLAKSEPRQSLLEHSRAVADMAKQIAISLGYEEKVVELCRIAGLLHDIGKAITPIQKALAKNSGGIIKITDKSNARHSAVGAWFIANHSYTFERIVPDCMAGDILCRAIAWHHKPYYPLDTSDFDYNEAFDAEIKVFVDTLIANLEWGFCRDDNFKYSADRFNYFSVDNSRGKLNWRIHAVRSVLIRADHLVSQGNATWRIPAIHKLELDNLQCPTVFDENRFVMQKDEIAKHAIDDGKNAVVINAPAGFGKTLVGLLAGLYRGEKMYWVVPRNVIADEVYRSITELLGTLGISSIYSVNLLTGGKIQRGPETADITVTNIDAILQPMGQRGDMGHQCDMLGGTMVFDEYHELVGDGPMWEAFLILLSARMGANGRTILVSATPIDVFSCIKTDPDKISYMPGKYLHYRAQHDVPYKFNTADTMPTEVYGDTFAISNSIARVQDLEQCGLMFHSKYTEEDGRSIVSALHESFGKGMANTVDGVSAGPILSTSLDLSCKCLFDSVCSPMDFMQRVGRCNRFGDKTGCEITAVVGSMPGEREYIKMKFTAELRKAWCDTIRAEFDGRECTLDEMYSCYDRFMEAHSAELNIWLNEKRKASRICLVGKCYPYAIITGDTKKPGVGSCRGTIRNPDPNIYYIVPSADHKSYYGPFSMDIPTATGRKYGIVFNQQNNITEYEKAKSIAPSLVAGTTVYIAGGKRQLNWYKNNANLLARSSDCPFVVPAKYMTYDKFKGIMFHGLPEE